ncbi:hypothetical protein KSP39_PZI003654 [Platanthera zijinensis]|uniref:Uncharacterized protein n=1 Tax=Platanthera zijinensis TaxID=2320716 RepID=A0AAP0BUL8_9ASPA
MAKWEPPRDPPSHRHGRRDYPSFSSSLLDAIYRSIDRDSNSKTPTLPHSSTPTSRSFPTPPISTHHRTRDYTDDRLHRRFFSATSSSDYASFGDFSSSSSYAYCASRPRPVLTRSDRIRPGPAPIQEKKTPSGGSIRTRIRDLRKSTPGSPGSRLSAFLNMLFAAAGGSPKKTKFAGSRVEPVTSSISSYSRSGTSKAVLSSGASGKQEPARLSPVSVVVSAGTRNRRRLVEIMRGFDQMEEDRESVSSSELFELESLTVIGRFSDELPVYATTNLGKTQAVSRSFIL